MFKIYSELPFFFVPTEVASCRKEGWCAVSRQRDDANLLAPTTAKMILATHKLHTQDIVQEKIATVVSKFFSRTDAHFFLLESSNLSFLRLVLSLHPQYFPDGGGCVQWVTTTALVHLRSQFCLPWFLKGRHQAFHLLPPPCAFTFMPGGGGHALPQSTCRTAP